MDYSMRGRNLFEELDNVDDVIVGNPQVPDISDEIHRMSEHVSVGTKRWWYHPCNQDQEVCLDYDSNGSQGESIGNKTTKETSFFSSCPGLSEIDIYGNPKHGDLKVECSEDSRENIFRRTTNPGYLTATLPSYPEERGPPMDTPFVVDADGFIMYVDKLPNLWSEVEGRGGDPMHQFDVDQLEIEGASPHEVPKLGNEDEESADRWEEMVVRGEDLLGRNTGEQDVLEQDVPSRVQRIKKRRELQRTSQLERERIVELEVAVMKEEADDLKKYKNERKKRYSRTGFAKELQMIGKRRSTIEYQGRRCTREQVLHILESKFYGVEVFLHTNMKFLTLSY
ncbi:hypothetical protein ZOSMA_197G00210 [Zostera marina]|uniref:Uncharacterized protein n=1 Tax=Zostera marina TaxID=29655 RepID=A0A0K9PNM6_ZOSMR|nr:hypothetical protein ZOSMA_197G00210 [Zostera marina]